MARAIALMLAAGSVISNAQAQRAFSPAWFADKGAMQNMASQTGRLPNGMPASSLTSPLVQQQKANEQLKRSLGNLNLAARGIAAQQAAQEAARRAAASAPSDVPEGLADGGLKVDTNTLTAGWLRANAPTQTVADGRTNVEIRQTGDKAVLNWETFNVGRHTTVDFKQDASWAILNRVNDPAARPSRILGQIKGDGTVLVVNRNGIVFGGTSQVNTRNLVAAAVGMSDSQFGKGLYSDAQGAKHIPTFANDLETAAGGFRHGRTTGDVIVEAGAKIETHKPVSVTEGGGYVLLAGREMHNHGRVVAAGGQVTLAAGDAFVVRRGLGTDENQASTTRGNTVTPLRSEGSDAGLVRNTGLLQASTGDVTLAGHDVRQQGVAVATSSVHTRGTVHLLNAKDDATGRVTLGAGSVTAILLDETMTTALDVQRNAMIQESDKVGDDVVHRRDQSLVRIASGGEVGFEGDSLTLATSGQVLVDAGVRTRLSDGARIDVSGAVGVRVAMEANNVQINVQGNEQRDAPVNRDGRHLANTAIWLDRRTLVRVPAGTNGYETDRWYTAGGLLEVGGYLGIAGHGIGEWSAQGGTVQFGGGELLTQTGSNINLSGGTLDVQTGKIRQTWLKGSDGRLYEASRAPGDLRYTGLYKGFESEHKRWGVTDAFYNPLIAAPQRLENGYTVGRDAGRLIVATQKAVLEGGIENATFQGLGQTQARDRDFDGYRQAQTAVANGAQLIVGRSTPAYDKGAEGLRYSEDAVAQRIAVGGPAGDEDIHLDAGWLNGLKLGALRLHAKERLAVREAVQVAPGGDIALHATQVQVDAGLQARGGRIALGNVFQRWTSNLGWIDSLAAPLSSKLPAVTTVGEGVMLDARGLWTNLAVDPADMAGLPFGQGGSIHIQGSGDVVISRGAVLDASGGAVYRADNSVQGGRGGDIALAANAYLPESGGGLGRLILDGTVRSHGMKGGGTLRLQSGGAVVIGGGVTGSDGRLAAGEASPLDLIAEESFTVKAGAILPADYRYVRALARPGEVIGEQPRVDIAQPSTYLTLAAAWTPPRPGSPTSNYEILTSAGQSYQVQQWGPLPTLPAGTVITRIRGMFGGPLGFPVGYTVPADVFPQGIGIQPSPAVIKAGSPAPRDVEFAAGTRIQAGERLAQDVAVGRALRLDSDLFNQGFSRYELTGHQSLAVAPGADLRVAMLVLRADMAAARLLPSGADPSRALAAWLPPEFAENPTKGQLTQRQGADLLLTSGDGPGSLGSLSVGRDARVHVDTGRTIGLTTNGQVTIDGMLRAAGGRIDLMNFGYGNEGPSAQGHDRSVWIGETAVLDVSAQARTAVDTKGRRYGIVADGGSIQIGGRYNANATSTAGVDNFIVVRPGARLDASGASATLDLPHGGATLVASDGGLIALSTYNGLFLDGTLRAAAGGEGAAGGTLALAMEAPNYPDARNPDARVRSLRELTLAPWQGVSALSAGLRPGQADTALAYGSARLGTDRVAAGGFDNLSLLVHGVLGFENGVDLKLGQSLRLTGTSFSLADGTAQGARVSLSAPHVRLAGSTGLGRDRHTMPVPFNARVPELLTDSRLRVESSLLDVIETVAFGTAGPLASPEGGIEVNRFGFEHIELRSQGDMRLLKPAVRDRTSLETAGDLVLAASQIYPATGALAEIRAGRRGERNEGGFYEQLYDPARSLRVERIGDTDPRVPFSAFGSLQLMSANIDQGGVLRAPLGRLILGRVASGADVPTSVVLSEGSITSTSGAGLTMPYGGTKDGLTYVYDGVDALYKGIGGDGFVLGGVTLQAERIDAHAGAVVDLSGGGALTGAAFLSGRGGSTDARLNPLVQNGTGRAAFVLPGLATNPVYAIVPGMQPGAAPIAAEKGAGDPAVGRQITIGAGVPGLPPGTYTLLPSTYALLPGAFRVELNGLAGSQAAFGTTLPMRNGSYSTSATVGVANTGIRDALSSQAILTPADVLRTYSQYNETSYAQFGLDWAARDGVPRPRLERDAGRLTLGIGDKVLEGRGVRFAEGVVKGAPAAGGFGSELVVNAPGLPIEILAPGRAATTGFDGVSLHADTLNAIGASTMAIGGAPISQFELERNTQKAYEIGLGRPNQAASSVVLREGAMLSASQVFLISGTRAGGITVEQGAGIHTLGRGMAAWDSTAGYVVAPGEVSVLAVSNGWLDMLAPGRSQDERYGPGSIRIGHCADSARCSGHTTLYAEGTITAATDRAFELGDTVRYGARNLVLAVGGINVGSSDALARASAGGLLPSGMTLNQQVLDRLLRGDTSTGAPALENLVLTARDSINFYESARLSTLDAATGKSSLAQLVLTTPAIHGYGGADDVARIETDALVWNGSALPAGAVVRGGAGTGSGRLVVDAREIVFGYAAQTQPASVASHDRMTLGFAAVELNASERISANHRGSLSVHRAQGEWNDAAKAFDYSGGDLVITTPQWTGRAGSVNSIRAGGCIVVSAPEGALVAQGAAVAPDALGAELRLDAGADLRLDTAVVLPSGKLSLVAQNELVLGDRAQLDLAGRKVDFFDVSKYSWGGDLVLESRAGNILQAAGSRIDLSAENNRAGRLDALALDAGAGMVDLRGRIAASSSGHHDAGGTLVPYAAGDIDVRAQVIADFAGLNARLTEGGAFGTRSFQLKRGDLVLGDELKAREINVSVDGGYLQVNGRVDASGEQVGYIRLAARDGVSLAGSAVLDASARVLRRDSHGQAIDAPNRATIEIDAGSGTLSIAGGARMDLRVDGAARDFGTVALNAPRRGGNDVAIDAAGAIAIDGARSVAVYAFATDKSAKKGEDAAVDGRTYQVIDQAYLDRLHGQSETFMRDALGNGALMTGRLAGLRAHGERFHLRPGLQIVADTDTAINPDGNLHVDGDIDLSGHRYASVNPRTQKTGAYGSGEAGALVIRAAGNLEIFGSISDGFDGSRLQRGATPDDKGWVLPQGRLPFGGDLVIAHGGLVTLDTGTAFQAGRTLNFDLPAAAAILPAGTLLPSLMVLDQALVVPAGVVLGAAVRDRDGNLLHAAGSVLAEAVTLPGGTRLDAGFRLPAQVRMAAGLWPAGVALPARMALSGPLALRKGAVVPSETDVLLPGGVEMVNLRPVGADGYQGRTWALAPMLPAGSQSWDMRLVAGADVTAADTRLTQPHTTARLQLADTHFGLGAKFTEVPGTGTPATYVWGPDASRQMAIDFYGEYVLSFEIVPGSPITPAQIAELKSWLFINSDDPSELNGYGYGDYAAVDTPAGPPDRVRTFHPAREQTFSVLRTGTGDLDLVSGGDLQLRSPYGVYTAGTASAPLAGGGRVDAYNQPRGVLRDGSLLFREEGEPFQHLVDGGSTSLYEAWYPQHGGNLLLRANGDIRGDLIGGNGNPRPAVPGGTLRRQIGSTAVGNWLWRQGTGSVAAGTQGVPVAWWINFGTYVAGANGVHFDAADVPYTNDPYLVGFTGFGTLGGGNLVVEAGGNAGMIGPRGEVIPNAGTQAISASLAPRSEGLHLVVASTGRMTPGGELVLTGGGDLDLRIGGSLNPNAGLRASEHDLNSTLVNLRGALRVATGAIGGLDLRPGTRDQLDSRGVDPYTAGRAFGGGGPVLVLGDSAARLDTRGDLVLGGVADPGRTRLLNATPFTYQGVRHSGEGWSWFSLWTPATGVDLFSAGGHLTPTTAWAEGTVREDVVSGRDDGNHSATGDGHFYPSILRAVAASGSLYYGVGTTNLSTNGVRVLRTERGLSLAPSPQGAQFTNATGKGELELLAHGSIYAGGYGITASSADPAGLSSPFRPGFVGVLAYTGGGEHGSDPTLVHNTDPSVAAYSGWVSRFGGRSGSASLFAFGTQGTSSYATPGQEPARYYAVEGDIVGLRFGQIASPGYQGRVGTSYDGSIPVAVRAGRDITDAGTRLGQSDSFGVGRGNLISHGHADDISTVEAGRDIRHSSFYVTGPGLLEVTAGRHLYFADNGEIKTLGAVVDVKPGDRSSGASVAVSAGMGAGADWQAFARRYLNPDNLADPAHALAEQPGKAVAIYSGALSLAQWLQREFGYGGDEAGANAFLVRKQAELDSERQQALAAGRNASSRSLTREYRLEGQLHLVNWLSERFGGRNGRGLHFNAETMDARQFFDALPPEQQRAYLRNVYYAELKASGREYNDADGKRHGSYLRGREAIATLLPENGPDGGKRAYEGDLTLFSSALYFDDWNSTGGVGKDRPTPGKTYITKAEWEALGRPSFEVAFYDVLDAGIHTLFGGDIHILTPGGRTLVGVDGGFVPGPGSGVMTQGEGDINMYARGSILMGQSRVFTTFGGNILGWSAAGDINAGRGSKTTVVYTPQRRVYDSVGNVMLSPNAPNTGAGIATLNPIPEIPPGDIDLIAPLGTIDAGEAGIRVSGNVNLAALQVVNAENIQVQGKSTGIPVIAAVNVGALTNASAAASQAATTAQDAMQRERAAQRQALPSVFTVRVLGFGNEAMPGAADGLQPPPRMGVQSSRGVPYDPASPVQFVGVGQDFDARQLARLSAEQRRQLQRER
ncbi:Heme/hemopexin-binding protein precursor [Variovorax boronicumulans]|uniref:filamentous haemagglutinin family protein n=1 Tax=Variovorax boronicumulans TaxID=436515 RepID=UPI0015525561|nr:filamentous haemagglutinin family protein [Variovorax boronicumulans]PBI85527.1 Heme/hemopexin-binding protein precursor [Variovorax boronicumulans]